MAITTAGVITCAYYTTTSSTGAISSGAVSLNTWSHVAAVYSAGVATLYLNGVVQSTGTYTGSLSLNGGGSISNLFLGAIYPSVYAYAGYVDDVRLYTAALTVNDIQAISGQVPMVACSISNDGSYLAVTNSAGGVYELNKNSNTYTLAIGNQAGAVNQGSNAIAIGNGAGAINQSGNSIVLNASGSAVNASSSGFYVAPIGTTSGLSMDLLGYGSDSQVVRTGVTVLPGGTLVAGGNVGVGGSVGIGTTAPSIDFDVRTGVSLDPYQNYAGIVLPRTYSGVAGIYSPIAIFRFGWYSNTWDIRAHRGGGSDMIRLSYAYSGNEMMCITNGGNVGIGTTNPGAKLDVWDSIYSRGKYLQLGGFMSSYIFPGVVGGAVFGSIGTNGAEFPTIYISDSSFVGIGVTNPGYKLHLSTDSAAKPGTNTWTIASDARLKTNIQLADTARCYEIIKTVSLKRYTWKEEVYTLDQVKDRSKLGWIAQDVEAVFPKAVNRHRFVYNQKYEDVVKEDGSVEKKLVSEDVLEDCLDLNADQLYAVMYGAVQQLIKDKESQAEEIAALQALLADKSAKLDALLAWAQSQGFSP
jgi:hypothetical protein